MSKPLSEHFQESEFYCSHCQLVGVKESPFIPKEGMDIALIGGLELMRIILDNRPLIITSGYRCPDHPVESDRRSREMRSVKEGKTSQHVLCRAADIYVRGLDWFILLQAAERVPQFKAGGIGIYPASGGNGGQDFIHVDTRPDGSARWGRWHGDYQGIALVQDKAWAQREQNTVVSARQTSTSIVRG